MIPTPEAIEAVSAAELAWIAAELAEGLVEVLDAEDLRRAEDLDEDGPNRPVRPSRRSAAPIRRADAEDLTTRIRGPPDWK